MTFQDEIYALELLEIDSDYIIEKGSIPILFTAPHTMNQIRTDGSIKLSEPYTKTIALYLNKHYNVSCMIKIIDTKIDSNRDNNDEFKKELIRFIKKNHIKLVIDLHGADKNRDFDIEFGTLNNLTADTSTIKELEDNFNKNGIYNMEFNNPFKGGAITQYIYRLKDVDVIQIEINGRYRNPNHIEELEKICKCFGSFIEKYKKYNL